MAAPLLLDELYWGTALPVNRINEELGLGLDRPTSELWLLATPLQAGMVCPYCFGNLVFGSRQRRKDNRAECRQCGHADRPADCRCGECDRRRRAHSEDQERERLRKEMSQFAVWSADYDTPEHLAMVWPTLTWEVQAIFRSLTGLLRSAPSATVTWNDVARDADFTRQQVDQAVDVLRAAQLIRLHPDEDQFRVNVRPLPRSLTPVPWIPPRAPQVQPPGDPLRRTVDDDWGERSDEDNWAVLSMLDGRFEDLAQLVDQRVRRGSSAHEVWWGTPSARGVGAMLDGLLSETVLKHGDAVGQLADCAQRRLRRRLAAPDCL